METLQAILLNTKLLGLEVFDKDFFELMLRFGFVTLVNIIIIRYLYYSSTQRKDFLFTFFLIGSTIFLMCFLLENIKLQIGFALGLFAIFGIIRYRTLQMPIKEMTYLFVIIGLAVVNALANKKISWAEIIFTNAIIIAIIWLLEKKLFMKNMYCKLVNYEVIENIKPQNYDKLKADLEERMGLIIDRIEIGQINFMRDTAKLKIYFYRDKNPGHSTDDTDDYTATDGDED